MHWKDSEFYLPLKCWVLFYEAVESMAVHFECTGLILGFVRMVYFILFLNPKRVWSLLLRCGLLGVSVGSLKCLPSSSNLVGLELKPSPQHWAAISVSAALSVFWLFFCYPHNWRRQWHPTPVLCLENAGARWPHCQEFQSVLPWAFADHSLCLKCLFFLCSFLLHPSQSQPG